MAAQTPNPEPARAADAERAPASLPRRLAALFALIALLASAALSSWWILTGRADFFAAGRQHPPAGSDEAPPEP
jgi:hypothetical protein